ncbi:hypothetical protein [Actinoplanes sp. NBRC 103695]|nr:hypothetical protein [Actinoplanes sp. NBRC 103695]
MPIHVPPGVQRPATRPERWPVADRNVIRGAFCGASAWAITREPGFG